MQLRGNQAPSSQPPQQANLERRMIVIGVVLWLLMTVVGVIIFFSLLIPSLLHSITRGLFNQPVSSLNSVYMTSANEGWVGGSVYTPSLDFGVGGSRTLLYHYANGSWNDVSIPLTRHVFSLMMVSKDEGWALTNIEKVISSTNDVSFGFGGSTFLHYSAGQWKQTSSPFVEAGLSDMDILANNDGWAVGGQGTILHYRDSRWSKVISPTNQSLTGISMVSPTDGWIVGDGGVILHYANGFWSSVSSPITTTIDRIHMITADEGWAIGTTFGRIHNHVGSIGVILHYIDGTWRKEESLDDLELAGIYMVSATDGWIVGENQSNAEADGTPQAPTLSSLILHYQNGKWNKVASPTKYRLSSVYMVSANEGWAVGDDIILHYQNGTWSEYQQ